jgi:hypothetical protein
VGGEHHALAALTLEKESLAPAREKAGWTPDPVWMIPRSENCDPYRDSNSDHSTVQYAASRRYTDCATVALIAATIFLVTLFTDNRLQLFNEKHWTEAAIIVRPIHYRPETCEYPSLRL